MSALTDEQLDALRMHANIYSPDPMESGIAVLLAERVSSLQPAHEPLQREEVEAALITMFCLNHTLCDIIRFMLACFDQWDSDLRAGREPDYGDILDEELLKSPCVWRKGMKA